MQKIKNIIFDIGNVLTVFAWKEHFEKFGYDNKTVEKMANASVQSTTWCEYDRGVLSEEEILQTFIQHDPSIEKELRMALGSMEGMVKRVDYAIPWIKKLKEAGYHLYYLSNFSEKAETDCAEALDFIPFMDGGILSYKDKVIKPEIQIYQLLLKRYGLKGEECVFLDDTAVNLPPAQGLGIQTIHFENKQQAIEELHKLEVFF